MHTESSTMEKKYLHGFTREEQDRLIDQAEILAPVVHSEVDFSNCHNILEIGCGVGAQTKILLRNFPHLAVESVDSEPAQIARAQDFLRKEIEAGKVSVSRQDAKSLAFPDNAFDGIFSSWLFEHVSAPVAITKEARRVLAPGGVFYGIEVMNSTFSLRPESPAVMEYWKAFNDLQVELNGDPFVGAKLGGYLKEAAFSQVSVTPDTFILDQRNPAEFKAKIDYWETLLLSAEPQLTSMGKIRPGLVEEMHEEFQKVKNSSIGEFRFTRYKFRAVK